MSISMAVISKHCAQPALKLANRGGRAAPARPFAGLFVFLLLLAFVAQGTAIQAHLHFLGPPGANSVAAADRAGSAATTNKYDTLANCRLCQEAALAGAYVLPAASTLPPPPPLVTWIAVAAMAAFGLPTAAHSWQSRAPPQHF